VQKDAPAGITVDASRLVIVALILLSAIGGNVYFNLNHPKCWTTFP
jgi:hypothetical protein